jgi:hypothetical protein
MFQFGSDFNDLGIMVDPVSGRSEIPLANQRSLEIEGLYADPGY